MIFLILFAIILGYAIFSYNVGKKRIGILIYFFFISNGFYLIPDSVIAGFPINKLSDFGTLYLVYVAFQLYIVKHERIKQLGFEQKWWGILFLYLTFSFLWTVATGTEIFGMSLAMYRTYFCFLSFILFQRLNEKDLKWIFQKVVLITLIATILYIVQPVLGFQTLVSGGIISEEGGGRRYRNISYLTYYLLIFYTVTLKFSSFKKIILLLVCLFALALTQHRGIMIGYVVTVLLYLLMERKLKQLFQFSIIGLVLFFAVGSFVFERFERADTGSDFKALVNLNYKQLNFEEGDEGGTLTFRILMLIERGTYLIENPQYLLQGVGMRHEDSPNTQRDFDFYLGSMKKQGGDDWIKEQISTGDLVWVTPLIKFGYLGLFLYVFVTYLMVSFFYRNKNRMGAFSQIAFYYYLLLVFISFKNDQLFSSIHLFMIFLLYQIISKNKYSIKEFI